MFTELERRALEAAQQSSRGNGHDFGFADDIVDALSDLSPQQVGALISNLIKKDVFEEPPESYRVNGEYDVSQFVLNEEYQR